MRRSIDFFGKKFDIGRKNFIERTTRARDSSGGKNFANYGGIGLSVEANTIQSVDNANNLTERTVERPDTGTTGCNQGSVNVEEEQLHAAILREGETYLRLQKDFRSVEIHFNLKSAGLFVTNKAEG